MRIYPDCFPCFFKQVLIAFRLNPECSHLEEAALKSICDDIKTADLSLSPAHTTTRIHRRLRELMGKDPFGKIKSEYNQLALRLYPELRSLVDKSPDPLWTAARIAIAGNIIDFGIFTSIDINSTIKKALDEKIAVDDYSLFRKSLLESKEVMYLLDNAGEIVFDRILIETIKAMGVNVTAVVKGSAVLNDVTMADAEESGLSTVCRVIDNGSDAIGTILDMSSPEFVQEFDQAKYIISKGQGNFETLHEHYDQRLAGRDVYYLFQSKCEVVSEVLGLEKGSMMLMKALK
ncbi:MAG: ARMT1-like domain-containing protein [Dissulfurispiraceae bacterium]|jgi:uncharacterized protein with ATP-grasp and redox domains|nr:ARMT1-like domain-containing protein [Dissulfurispiraceae bacterium]